MPIFHKWQKSIKQMRVSGLLVCWGRWIRLLGSHVGVILQMRWCLLGILQVCILLYPVPKIWVPYILVHTAWNLATGEKRTNLGPMCLFVHNFVEAHFSPTGRLHSLGTRFYGIQFWGKGYKMVLYYILIWCVSGYIWWRIVFALICVFVWVWCKKMSVLESSIAYREVKD